MQILGISFCIIVAIFGLAAFIFACEQSRDLRKIEKEIEEEERKKNEITAEANKTKAHARTGDHERDFNYMADKLHDLSKK